jgi:hypothetical protein
MWASNQTIIIKNKLSIVDILSTNAIKYNVEKTPLSMELKNYLRNDDVTSYCSNKC